MRTIITLCVALVAFPLLVSTIAVEFPSATTDRLSSSPQKIKAAFLSPQFQTDVVKPLKLEDFIDQEVKNLSGGELQRVAMLVILPLFDIQQATHVSGSRESRGANGWLQCLGIGHARRYLPH